MTTDDGSSYIDGVVQYPFEPHDDDRGQLVEIFRNAWTPGFSPVQWNLIRSRGNVLRGFHCHIHHTDMLVVVEGSTMLGLKDLRTDSRTADRSELLTLTPASGLVLIPPGVGHGFYFAEPATMLNVVSHEWSRADDVGCRWDDPSLDLHWGCDDPVLSERDRTAGTLGELQLTVEELMRRAT